MGYSIVSKVEVRAGLLAGLVFVVRCAQYQGGDPQFVGGALVLAEHRALETGLDWPGLLADARATLGIDSTDLLDAALDARTTLEGSYARV